MLQRRSSKNFYHGLILGILFFKNDWDVSSNRESGDGYYDIAIEIEDEGIGNIIEVKYAEEARYEDACTEAMEQINKTGYTKELKEDGMWKILKYGIACYRKQCRVVLEREEG